MREQAKNQSKGNGTVLRYVAELPEDKRKVLYVDTEQSPYHCLKVMKRILRMAGLPDNRDNENLEFLTLRKYTPEQRIMIAEQELKQVKSEIRTENRFVIFKEYIIKNLKLKTRRYHD